MNDARIPSTTIDERGAVLILAAVLVGVVFIMLAFAVDLGRFAIAHTEHRKTAAIAALGALRTYWQSALEKEDSARREVGAALKDAVTSAVQLSSRVENVPIFSASTTDKRKIEIDPDFDFSPEDDSSGALRLGYWHYREPAGGCRERRGRRVLDSSCPCPENRWQGPCFERQTSKRKRDTATALQLEIFTSREGPFRWLFVPVFGERTSGIRARATVSLLSESEVLSTPRIVENVSLPPYGPRPSLATRDISVAKSKTAAAPVAHDTPQHEEADKIERENEAEDTEKEEPDPCEHGTESWNEAGVYTFRLPPGCRTLTISAWGAGGAGAAKYNGGAGGFASGAYELGEPDSLRVIVGSGGMTPCGPGFRERDRLGSGGRAGETIGEGGGYSGVFRASNAIVIAGGGAAAGSLPEVVPCTGEAHGGSGGGELGQDGELPACLGDAARGGTQRQGGAGAMLTRALSGSYQRGGDNGGGGGLYGGGGARVHSGGAAGGSGYLLETLGNKEFENGAGRIPPQTDRREYESPAGVGGNAGCELPAVHGGDGQVLVEW